MGKMWERGWGRCGRGDGEDEGVGMRERDWGKMRERGWGR